MAPVKTFVGTRTLEGARFEIVTLALWLRADIKPTEKLLVTYAAASPLILTTIYLTSVEH